MAAYCVWQSMVSYIWIYTVIGGGWIPFFILWKAGKFNKKAPNRLNGDLHLSYSELFSIPILEAHRLYCLSLESINAYHCLLNC